MTILYYTIKYCPGLSFVFLLRLYRSLMGGLACGFVKTMEHLAIFYLRKSERGGGEGAKGGG